MMVLRILTRFQRFYGFSRIFLGFSRKYGFLITPAVATNCEVTTFTVSFAEIRQPQRDSGQCFVHTKCPIEMMHFYRYCIKKPEKMPPKCMEMYHLNGTPSKCSPF